MTKFKDTMGNADISVDISVDNNEDGFIPSYMFSNTSELDIPKELQIPGHTLLWVAKTVVGQPVDNFSVAYRQGYRPVLHENHPKISSYVSGPTMSGEPRTGCVEKGGLALMMCPTVLNNKIKEYNENQSKLQKQSANFFNRTGGALDSYDRSSSEFKRDRGGSFGD